MRETSDCTANFALSDNIIETKSMRHNHDVIYQGNLEKCSIEIAEIRFESSAKKSKDEMYSKTNGKELNAAVHISEPKYIPEKGNPPKKKHVEIRLKREDSLLSKFSRPIVEDTSDSDSGEKHIIYKLLEGKKKRLIMDRYEFRCEHTRKYEEDSNRRLWCCLNRKTKCSARLFTFDNERIVELRNVGHNHLPKYLKDISSYTKQRVCVRYFDSTKKSKGKQEGSKKNDPIRNTRCSEMKTVEKQADVAAEAKTGSVLRKPLQGKRDTMKPSECQPKTDNQTQTRIKTATSKIDTLKPSEGQSKTDNQIQTRMKTATSKIDTLKPSIIHYIPGLKHRILVFKNFEYKKERNTPKRTMWCCTKKEKLKCKARVVTHGFKLILKNQSHNHPPTFQGDITKCQMEFATIITSKFYVRKKSVAKNKLVKKGKLPIEDAPFKFIVIEANMDSLQDDPIVIEEDSF
ncbi:unnamed protein product [Phaedon cochleariae]|uniref:FLYWCH-type domain-containing protein n=1 Tax=Phaedon cochleariae TaxID=80249 RepID=A0A9N9SJY9_PHACE|nr:unnamed protein product [Phaedon cochleariae]